MEMTEYLTKNLVYTLHIQIPKPLLDIAALLQANQLCPSLPSLCSAGLRSPFCPPQAASSVIFSTAGALIGLTV